jgi:hypothetical protein
VVFKNSEDFIKTENKSGGKAGTYDIISCKEGIFTSADKIMKEKLEYI